MVIGPFRVVEYPEGVPKNAPPLLFSVPPLMVTPYRSTVAPDPLAGMLAPALLMVVLLARALRPLMVWLFPDVPADHPAMGSMLLNMAASILGLGNAATPLGLRAMKDLETLNPRPGTATNAMCTYLAINTSSIQLIPATAIAVLAANNASNPTAIVGTSIMATTCAAIAAV